MTVSEVYAGVNPKVPADSPHVCVEGVVYIGHLVEEDGEEVEAFVAYPCRRCQPVQNA